jgi:hypothetical protein
MSSTLMIFNLPKRNPIKTAAKENKKAMSPIIITGKIIFIFRKAGFFFGGIMQTAEGKDYLMLQYLNNQMYNYDILEVFSDFAKELVTYIRHHDPSQE